MLKTFDEVSDMINLGKWLHISGNEGLLKKLPSGNWIGGSTEYFMSGDGGRVTDEKLFVSEIPYDNCAIVSYDENNIENITKDAFENGFTIAILPFDSEVHKVYAANSAGFKGMFAKNIVGWISGVNLSKKGQTPITVNGKTTEGSSSKAVALHIQTPNNQMVNIGIVNIFTPNEDSPVIEFHEDGFSMNKCLIDGREVVFADYLARNGIDTKLPLVGSYSGAGINVSFKQIENGTVHFYAPVFRNIKYRFANKISDYAKEFAEKLEQFKNAKAVFSCNCILNFLYGELENKQVQHFYGPITFGEIAYQLVNQTLVYVVIL
ncbi:MAG: hypothetical protein FWF13_03610 [Acidobacteria bacterium]|nr:hypothetical protein [Acidobacteriota bacterium]